MLPDNAEGNSYYDAGKYMGWHYRPNFVDKWQRWPIVNSFSYVWAQTHYAWLNWLWIHVNMVSSSPSVGFKRYRYIIIIRNIPSQASIPTSSWHQSTLLITAGCEWWPPAFSLTKINILILLTSRKVLPVKMSREFVMYHSMYNVVMQVASIHIRKHRPSTHGTYTYPGNLQICVLYRNELPMSISRLWPCFHNCCGWNTFGVL